MDEYIRKHDAIAIAESYQVERTGFHLNDYEYGRNQVADSIASDLEDMPVADVIRPVRCHDCKYVNEWRSEESAKKFGQVYECRKGILNCPDPNDFCSRGDRKE